MNHPERSYHEQWGRVERLVKLTQAKDHFAACPGLSYYDLVVLTCQAMWSLKDWVLNDANFDAADKRSLKSEIHDSHVLAICADIANGTKHFRLDAPKTDFSIRDRMGIHVEPAKGIFQEFVVIVSADRNHPLSGLEARDFLFRCLSTWQGIIDKHYLSKHVL